MRKLCQINLKMNFFILIEDKEYGPYSKDELQEFLKTQRANINTPTREDSCKTYRYLYEVLEDKVSDDVGIETKVQKSNNPTRNKLTVVSFVIIFVLVVFTGAFVTIYYSISKLEKAVNATVRDISKISNDESLEIRIQVDKQNERIEELLRDISIIKKEVSQFKESYGNSFNEIDLWKKDLLNDFNKKLNESGKGSHDLIKKYSDELDAFKKSNIEFVGHLNQSNNFKRNYEEIIKKQQRFEENVNSKNKKYDEEINKINGQLDLISTSLKSLLKLQEQPYRNR